MPDAEGGAGQVEVSAGDLQVRNGGAISTATHSIGSAGTVSVQAGHLFISGDGAPADTTFTGIGSQSWSTAKGDAGQVGVSAGDLEICNGGAISTDTYSTGNAGTVLVQADHRLISGNGSPYFTSINSDADFGLTGGADIAQVTAGGLQLLNGGQISSNTYASGNAGRVQVQADQLLISGASTSISSLTDLASTGAGGAVTVGAQTMQVRDGGTVSTQSNGSGVGGSISINVTDIDLDHAAIQSRTAIADGGNIKLAVGHLFDLRNSSVTTSVAEGTGSGGDILINSPLMVFDNSQIIANAQGGSGGNINIQAGQLIRTPDSVIQASSAQSVSGNITINAPNTDVAGSLVVLPETFFDVSSQLREACAVRGGRPASSLNAGGRGGLPPDPGAPLAASPFAQPLEQQTATGSPTKPSQAVKPITVSGIPQPVLGSPRLTCRG
jgi:large exoprotein involved in heme utilization and adhesion